MIHQYKNHYLRLQIIKQHGWTITTDRIKDRREYLYQLHTRDKKVNQQLGLLYNTN